MRFFFFLTKEMVLIVAIAVLPVFIFGFIALNRSVEVAQVVAERENRIIAANFANQTQLYLTRAQDIIKSLAAFSFENIDETSLRAVYENNNFQEISMFESLVLIDEQGKLKAIYPEKEEMLGLDYSRRSFFEFVKGEKKTFFSRVKFSPVTEQPVVEIAAPILKKDQDKTLSGVVEGSIKLQGLSSLVREFALGKNTGEAFLVGEFGEIIAHPDYQLVGEQENIANIYPELATIIQEITEGAGIFQYLSPEDVEYLVSFQIIHPTNWKLIIRQDVE